MKKRPTLIIEIAVIIAVKLSIVFGLWYFFFSPEHRPDMNPTTVGEHMFGPAVQTPQPTKQ